MGRGRLRLVDLHVARRRRFGASGASLTQPLFHGGALGSPASISTRAAHDGRGGAVQNKTVLAAFQSVADTLVSLEGGTRTRSSRHAARRLLPMAIAAARHPKRDTKLGWHGVLCDIDRGATVSERRTCNRSALRERRAPRRYRRAVRFNGRSAAPGDANSRRAGR